MFWIDGRRDALGASGLAQVSVKWRKTFSFLVGRGPDVVQDKPPTNVRQRTDGEGQRHSNATMSGNVIVYSLFALIVGVTVLAVREAWRATRREKKARSAHSGGSAAE